MIVVSLLFHPPPATPPPNPNTVWHHNLILDDTFIRSEAGAAAITKSTESQQPRQPLQYTHMSSEYNTFVEIAQRPQRICKWCYEIFPLPTAPNATAVVDRMIQEAITRAESFHMGGGNLHSIQTYLDRSIDTTFDELQVVFRPRKRVQFLAHSGDRHSGYDYRHNDNNESSSSSTVAASSTSRLIRAALAHTDTNDRGGYDQRKLPGRFIPIIPAIRKGRRVDVFEPVSWERWRVALGPPGPNCTNLDRIRPLQRKKDQHYADKFMCGFQDLVRYQVERQKQQTSATESEHSNYTSKCDFISIGSNNQWGFEKAIIEQTSCRVHTFDCTISEPINKPVSDHILFYPACIAGEDIEINGRRYLSYRSLWRLTGMKHAPKLLKMDVEGFEYDVLSSLLDDGGGGRRYQEDETFEILPEQIIVELHYGTRMYDLPWLLRFRQAAEISLLVGRMYQSGGYLPVHMEYNEGCPFCLEVLFVKILCL